MRVVTSPNFCGVCIEGLWHSLLRRVDLIDDIRSGCFLENVHGKVKRFISVTLLEIGQFREKGIKHDELYTIRWRKDGVELPEHANQTQILLEDSTGEFTVDVHFISDEIRVDPHGLLSSSATIDVTGDCITGVHPTVLSA